MLGSIKGGGEVHGCGGFMGAEGALGPVGGPSSGNLGDRLDTWAETWATGMGNGIMGGGWRRVGGVQGGEGPRGVERGEENQMQGGGGPKGTVEMVSRGGGLRDRPVCEGEGRWGLWHA